MGRYGTTTKYLLEAILANKHAYKRRDLITHIAQHKQITTTRLQVAFSRAIKANLLILDEFDNLILTTKGKHAIAPFVADTLPGSVLMVIFDIAEADRSKRDHLRLLLKELSFELIQKSVWATPFDHRDYLQAEIKALGLEQYVKIYEARML